MDMCIPFKILSLTVLCFFIVGCGGAQTSPVDHAAEKRTSQQNISGPLRSPLIDKSTIAFGSTSLLSTVDVSSVERTRARRFCGGRPCRAIIIARLQGIPESTADQLIFGKGSPLGTLRIDRGEWDDGTFIAHQGMAVFEDDRELKLDGRICRRVEFEQDYPILECIVSTKYDSSLHVTYHGPSFDRPNMAYQVIGDIELYLEHSTELSDDSEVLAHSTDCEDACWRALPPLPSYLSETVHVRALLVAPHTMTCHVMDGRKTTAAIDFRLNGASFSRCMVDRVADAMEPIADPNAYGGYCQRQCAYQLKTIDGPVCKGSTRWQFFECIDDTNGRKMEFIDTDSRVRFEYCLAYEDACPDDTQ